MRFQYLRMHRSVHACFLKHMTYYRQLDTAHRRLFIARAVHFVRNTAIEGKEGLKVSQEMRWLVAGAAAQLSFGLGERSFDHFNRVLLYPGPFKHPLYDQPFLGSASTKGTLSLSWQHLKEGYADDTDNRNLGLHELAHALKLGVLHGGRFDGRFAAYLEQWLDVSELAFRALKNNRPSFLRAYGGANPHEFFAVCVEHFFESPEDFYKDLPEVYNHLCVLLNQNTRNERGNFKLTKDYIREENKKGIGRPLPVVVNSTVDSNSWHWSLTVLLVGIFVGWPAFIYLRLQTFLAPDQVITLLLGSAAVAFVWQIKQVLTTGFMAFKMFVFYVLAACTPLIAWASLLANKWVVTDQREQPVVIEAIRPTGTGHMKFYFDQKRFNEVTAADHMGVEDYRALQDHLGGAPNRAKITLDIGVFGWETVGGRSFERLQTTSNQ